MTDTTFAQFQAQIQQAKERMAESSKRFAEELATLAEGTPLTLAEIESQVDIDADELKKLEGEMGAELNQVFTELAKEEGEPVDEGIEGVDESTEEVEKKD